MLKRGLTTLALLLVVTLSSSLARADPIRLWHAYRGAELQALQQAVATWNGAEVELLAIPHDAFAAKLGAAIPLGDGPHLFIDAHERLGSYLERDLVAPVGDALPSDAAEAFHRVALDAVLVTDAGGAAEHYGVPLSLKCVAMYYNPTLVAEPLESLEAIAALSLPDGVVPLVYEAHSAYGHAPLLHAYDGRLLGDEQRFGFVGERAARSIEHAKRLIDDGVVPENVDGALVTDLFRSGRAAVAFSGPWLASDLKDSATPYRVAVLPKVAETGQRLRPLLTVESILLSPHGAAREDVRALAKHLAAADAARVRMKVARTVSARADVDVPIDDGLLRAFTQQAALAVPMSTSTAMRAVWEPAERAIRKVLRGDMSANEALREAEARFEHVRRPTPPPASPTPLGLVLGMMLLWGAWALVKRARQPEFREHFRASLPAYRYVLHAVVAVGLLVFLPLLAGAAISLCSGQPGKLHYVGSANFIDILTVRGRPLFASGSFYVVLLVTVAWTALNLALHLGIGMLLGVLLSRPLLRLRAAYRVLLILPWAVPNYVTALAWKGMFHRQFGAVTGLIEHGNALLGTRVEPVDWFAQFSTSFAANVTTNVWLGFPFMMVVTIAAMTSVPKDVLEAAEIDGASRWQRFARVTLPIIRPSMLPAAVLGAIWTFNMFNVVFLVSGGEPDGTTDILVTEAYRWAFTRQANYGYAAAYAVIIFGLLMLSTKVPAWIGRRVGRAREAAAA